MEIGLPVKTDAFYRGQDILYSQFNDINFYVEDEDQENFYEATLKKLFPQIRLEKIFPLNGKPNVVTEAQLTLGDKKKVYIVDKDFDDLLNIKKTLPNLFYLEKYSIENYLLEPEAIQNLVIEERPKIKPSDFNTLFSLPHFQKETKKLFSEVISAFLVIQKYSLGIKNVKYDPARFCNLNHPHSVKTTEFVTYKSSIESALKLKNKKLSLNAQIKKFMKFFSNRVKPTDSLRHIPGKYILVFLKAQLRYLFDATSFNNLSLESLSIRLANKCKFTELLYLQKSILSFIKN